MYNTGPCKSDAECRSRCCGWDTGKCEGPIQAVQIYGGCGFGDAQPNDIAARDDPRYKGPGEQWILGPCKEDTDCESRCCGFNTGACQGPVLAQQTDGGCGHGGSQPNSIEAQVIRGKIDPGNGQGGAYITAKCYSDADCASNCCGRTAGVCAGHVYARENYGGCGHRRAA